jgi:hypothetical protein
VLLYQTTKSSELARTINGAQLRALAQAESTRFRVMKIRAMRDKPLDIRRLELA